MRIRILKPLRSDIKGTLVEEFSTPAISINLGNALSSLRHEVGYMGNVEPSRLALGSTLYETNPCDPEMIQIARALMTYRDDGWDILHLHTVSFSAFKQLLKYSSVSDRIVVTLHMPPNIGRSFFYHHTDLTGLLRERPNFRLVCVSDSGSYQPLKRFFGVDAQGRPQLPAGFDKVRVISNGILSPRVFGVRPVPANQKLDRFMFVAHMVHNKNVLRTLEVAVENRIRCLYVGRRFPYRDGKIPANEEDYANKCEAYIAANADIIEHRPHLPYGECIQNMALSRCLLVLSDLESFGLTPVEAALVGTPTIWLECQGIDDTMIDGMTGRRIRRKEYRTWKARKARAVELYQDIHNLDQMAMFQHVHSNYLIQHVADQYVELYNELMNGAPVRVAA